MEKLIALANAGVSVVLIGPGSKYNWQPHWQVDLEKSTGGAKLELSCKAVSPEEAIGEAYDKWVQATKGLPEHGLLQIEHLPAETPVGRKEEESIGELSEKEEYPF